MGAVNYFRPVSSANVDFTARVSSCLASRAGLSSATPCLSAGVTRRRRPGVVNSPGQPGRRKGRPLPPPRPLIRR